MSKINKTKQTDRPLLSPSPEQKSKNNIIAPKNTRYINNPDQKKLNQKNPNNSTSTPEKARCENNPGRRKRNQKRSEQRSQIKANRPVVLQAHQKAPTNIEATISRPIREPGNSFVGLYHTRKLLLRKTATLRRRRRRLVRVRRKAFADEFCLMCVKRTKNNTHLSISRLFGDRKTLWTISGGQTPSIGSKSNGRRKSRYCQRMIFKAAIEKLYGLGLRYLVIHCIGHTLSKRYIFKNFFRRFRIVLVKDVLGIPHNGCRPRSVRRL